jgi:23S rRNA pseudouridine1911/1915/1917 synthase
MADQEVAAVTPSWRVPPQAAGIRVDSFVRRCLPHLSQREAKRAIEEGAFWVDQRPARKGDRLAADSVLSLRGFEHLLASSPIPSRNSDASILYEDHCLIALDKPAGIPTHGFSGRETGSLANIMASIRPSLVGVGRDRWEAGLVHRLDRDTSGIVLAAKDQATFGDLREAFHRGAVQKFYRALVWGRTRDEGVIDTRLEHDSKDRRKMKPCTETREPGAKPKSWRAVTRFRRRAHVRGFSLLDVEICTGVTHQIRVHLSSLGHSVVGDSLYGEGDRDPFGLGRLFLHAWSLRLSHPRENRDLVLQSPLPPELNEVLDELGIGL